MVLIISIFLSIAVGYLVLCGTKTAIGIIISLFIAIGYVILVSKIHLVRTNKYLLYFIIATVPFPISMQFMGRDALTITTVMIFVVFSMLILDRIVKKTITIGLNYELVLPILLLFGFTVSLLFNPRFWGESFRYYIANCSGVLLYFAVLATIRKQSEVIFIIKIILFTLILQSLITFLQLKFPHFGNYLSLFAARSCDLNSVFREGQRAVGTVSDYELLAEWFLIGTILSVALQYKMKKYIFSIPMFCCVAGIIFTKTRSAILLLPLAFMLISTLLNLFKKDNKLTSIKIIILLISGTTLMTVMFKNQVYEFYQRLDLIAGSSTLLSAETANREGAWNLAYEFLRPPTVFGKGLYDITSLPIIITLKGGFHSLYFTILYKMGVFGCTIYAIFWLKMLQKALHTIVSVRESNNWYTIFFLMIALVMMLINEIKIDYLRYGHTIQFAWLIYALLVVSIRQNKESYENIVVPKVAI